MDERENQVQDMLNRGISAMQLERYEAAADCLRQAAELDPENFDATIQLGNALANLEKFDEAIEAFQNALLIVAAWPLHHSHSHCQDDSV